VIRITLIVVPPAPTARYRDVRELVVATVPVPPVGAAGNQSQ